MNLNWSRISVAAALLILTGCGGGGSTPTAPTASTPAPAPALTIAGVAPSLGSEINSAFIAAMRSGVQVATRNREQHHDYLRILIETFIGVPLHAQGGFVANCSSSGNVRVQYLGAAPGGGRVTLANTPVTFSTCTHSLNGRSVVATGTLMASGTWSASEPTSPVRLAGDLTVNEIGIVAIDGAIGANFIGVVGGVQIGVADTPPPPNPAPPVCPTPVPTPACPAPTPPTTPSAINLTGTWRDAGAATGTMSLTQSGSSISGSVAVPPTPGATVGTNSISGSISGNAVTLTWTLVLIVRSEGITVTTTGTSVFSLVASSSTAMSGQVRTTATAVCSGSQEFCPPPITTTSTSSTSMVKQ